MSPYFGLRSYTDDVKCYDCIQMEYAGRDPRQAWPGYDAHVAQVHRRHYDGQIGSEATPAEWVAALVACTAEWVRVLKPSGSIFVNLGDKYSGAQQQSHGHQSTTSSSDYWQRTNPKNTGIPAKSLMQLPQRYSIACTDQLGLILRITIIWSKPNGLPESVTDRCRSSHEYLFHFTVRPRYYAAVDEIREEYEAKPQRRLTAQPQHGAYIGQNKQTFHDRVWNEPMAGANPLGKLPGSVWNIPSQPLVVPAHLGVDHFAAFPMELPRRCILGWSPPGVCTVCGEGRRPVSDKDRQPLQRVHNGRSFMSPDHGPPGHGKGPPRDSLPHRTTVTITGYACACPDDSAPVRPAVVVDPFAGTGTTMLVASALGRIGIGVDRSMDYARLARWRTADPGEIAKAMQVPKPPPRPEGQATLFDEIAG